MKGKLQLFTFLRSPLCQNVEANNLLLIIINYFCSYIYTSNNAISMNLKSELSFFPFRVRERL